MRFELFTGTGRRAGPWRTARAFLVLLVAAAATVAGVTGTQDAIANGDTRTLTIYHEHTKESATITFRRNGSYDGEALKQLNWLLRDWRLDEPTRMQPRLFDIVWQVYREVGASEPIHVVSAYRSPQTNAMLRRRSKAVAEHSQHMRGYAMDFYIPEVSMARVREIGMRLQDGGVGFYPNAMNPFVHLDAGSVRSWPRMPGTQLARLFPDGRTVHIPREGRPLGGYEVAKAEIIARGGSVAGFAADPDSGEEGGGRKSLWAMLFGGGDDEDTEFYRRANDRDQRFGAAAAAPAPSRSARRGGTRLASAEPAAPSPEPTPSFFALFGGGSQPAAAPPTPARPAPAPLAAPAPVPAAPLALQSAALGSGPEPDAPTDDAPAPARASLRTPVPPRRPEEFAALLSPVQVANAPLPPSRPVMLAAAAGTAPPVPLPVERPPPVNGQMRAPAFTPVRAAAPPPPTDERSALRVLFEAAATPVGATRSAGITTSRAAVQPIRDLPDLRDPDGRVSSVFSAARLDPDPAAFSGSALAPPAILR